MDLKTYKKTLHFQLPKKNLLSNHFGIPEQTTTKYESFRYPYLCTKYFIHGLLVNKTTQTTINTRKCIFVVYLWFIKYQSVVNIKIIKDIV